MPSPRRTQYFGVGPTIQADAKPYSRAGLPNLEQYDAATRASERTPHAASMARMVSSAELTGCWRPCSQLFDAATGRHAEARPPSVPMRCWQPARNPVRSA